MVAMVKMVEMVAKNSSNTFKMLTVFGVKKCIIRGVNTKNGVNSL